MRILVLNSGSSSIKFQLIDTEQGQRLARGQLERIGQANGQFTLSWLTDKEERQHRETLGITDHRHGLALSFRQLSDVGILADPGALDGIGHRVVHGGDRFQAPILVDDAVVDAIGALTDLAPLHLPANLMGIQVARAMAPNVPQVAVFDTAFHHTLPPRAYLYALPRELQQQHGIRRYGFHGSSHQFVAQEAARFLNRPLEQLNLITLHLGNGASATAIQNGRSVDTSMGLTPLEGLVMGTRSGDLDPAIVLRLVEHAGMTPDAVEQLLNFDSGLKGLCGASDMREIQQRAAQGDEIAVEAIEVFCYRVKKYIGAYLAVLGKLDALVFTGGIGENAPAIRAQCCAGLDALNITVEPQRNATAQGDLAEISPPGSVIRVLVIPTDEEWQIAREARACIERAMG